MGASYSAPQPPRKCLALVWEMPGTCLGNAWHLFGTGHPRAGTSAGMASTWVRIESCFETSFVRYPRKD